MEISVRKQQDVQVMQLHGDLRLGEPVDSFRQTAEELLAAGDTRIVLNLEDVRMVDSSGIGSLVKILTSAKQRGGALKLVNPSKFTVQTLKLVGLLNLFEVYEDEATAVASYSA